MQCQDKVDDVLPAVRSSAQAGTNIANQTFAPDRLLSHFEKHGAEFGYQTPKQEYWCYRPHCLDAELPNSVDGNATE